MGTGRSEIRNRVLAPIFKDLKLIEAWGTGITKMKNEVAKYSEIELQLLEMGHAFQVQFRKKEVGTKQRTSTGQVTGQVIVQVLNFSRKPRKASEIQKHLGMRHRETFVNNYLVPLLSSGWVERTIPEKPKSRFQKYRTTAKGIAILEQYPSRLK